MRVHDLKDNDGSRRKRKRKGRGPGSGTGKTAGRGMNGQKARSGTALGSFEGGQMPIYQRLPKRGFNNINRRKMSVVNLSDIQRAVDSGLIDSTGPVDEQELVDIGLVRRRRDGIRLLGNGMLNASVQLKVNGASASAVKAVRAAGGDVLVWKDDRYEPA